MQLGYYFELPLFPSSAYIRRGQTLSSTQFCNTVLKHNFHMQVEREAIEEHIKGVFQQGLVSLCQFRVILASSLRAEHSWWIFVRDLTLLMQ
jgi:hypothetical protein